MLNAIGHKDYFSNASVSVEIYSDRVEITNPGGLVKGLDKKDLGKKSMPRNRLLFRLMQRMDLVEEAGTGIQRIKDAMNSYKLKSPKFEISKDWFTIIFDRPKDSYEERIYGKEFKGVRGVEKGIETMEKGGQISGQVGGQILTEKQKKILGLIKKNPSITREELSNNLDINPSAVQKHIEKLKKDGVIRRVGPDKGGYWEIL